MLTSLSIQNVVLIDRLTLEGDAGLSALTGETGAGKSILLDALGLALGSRADSSLVRHGEEQASVTACFELPAKHPVFALLADKGIPFSDTLLLRRTLSKDGKSRAFINDAPVSAQLLKETASELVEIHGQFETQGLLNPDTHRATLDEYAKLPKDVAELKNLWSLWRAAKEKLESALSDVETLKLQEEYLRYTVAELEKLSPQAGEERVLAQKRQFLMSREKMQGAFDQATEILDGEDGVQTLLGRLQGNLERIGASSRDMLSPAIDALSRAKAEIDDVSYQIEKLKNGGSVSEDDLGEIEERYFALKECARKHRVLVDDLPRIHEELAQKLKLITHQDDALADLQKAVKAAKDNYLALAKAVSAKRKKAAEKLAKAVNAELPDLKLDKAAFGLLCEEQKDETAFGPEGIDRVQFMVSTNPQTPAGPLHKIASGGELSRFMLALKVILAETGSVPTLIFDEADSGIGGATADAVGERLQRLAKKYQVLAVTHSPQVAARAKHHWHVAKTGQKGTVITRITPLKGLNDRVGEIARMLSGTEITVEARAQAARLLEKNVAA